MWVPSRLGARRCQEFPHNCCGRQALKPLFCSHCAVLICCLLCATLPAPKTGPSCFAYNCLFDCVFLASLCHTLLLAWISSLVFLSFVPLYRALVATLDCSAALAPMWAALELYRPDIGLLRGICSIGFLCFYFIVLTLFAIQVALSILLMLPDVHFCFTALWSIFQSTTGGTVESIKACRWQCTGGFRLMGVRVLQFLPLILS